MTGADGNWKKFLFQGVSCLRNKGKIVGEQDYSEKHQKVEEDNGSRSHDLPGGRHIVSFEIRIYKFIFHLDQ
jgi:hypothetical protein